VRLDMRASRRQASINPQLSITRICFGPTNFFGNAVLLIIVLSIHLTATACWARHLKFKHISLVNSPCSRHSTLEIGRSESRILLYLVEICK
jgi:hypothetical protein